MSQDVEYLTERLDHMGIVAGVCQQAGIAEWLVKQTGENRRIVIALSFIWCSVCWCTVWLSSFFVANWWQRNKPTNRPTMRWIFQCFEDIDPLQNRIDSRWQSQILGLQSLHQQDLRLLSPVYSQFYFSP